MAICIDSNKIKFDNYTLYVTSDGVCTDGTFTSRGQILKTPVQGITYGFVAGGAPTSTTGCTEIQNFSFATDAGIGVLGDMTTGLKFATGSSSQSHGYISGGCNGTPPETCSTINKFPFVSEFNYSSNVGNLSPCRIAGAGQSSNENGYVSGGLAGSYCAAITKFPFAIGGGTTVFSIGSLTFSRRQASGISSTENGYTAGGDTGATTCNIIDKFPFASDTNATDVGDLTCARYSSAGHSSAVSGYISGGWFTPPQTRLDIIDKFPFASDTNATDVGDLTTTIVDHTGHSSMTDGYTAGGCISFTSSTCITKFPFAVDAGSSGTADLRLCLARCNSTGHQV